MHNANDFKTNEKGELVEAEGSDPWKDLKELIAKKSKPKANKQVQERLTKLKDAVKVIMNSQAQLKPILRSRSVSRTRSEDSDDKAEEGPSKLAKMDVEDVEEVSIPSLDDLSSGPRQQ